MPIHNTNKFLDKENSPQVRYDLRDYLYDAYKAGMPQTNRRDIVRAASAVADTGKNLASRQVADMPSFFYYLTHPEELNESLGSGNVSMEDRQRKPSSVESPQSRIKSDQKIEPITLDNLMRQIPLDNLIDPNKIPVYRPEFAAEDNSAPLMRVLAGIRHLPIPEDAGRLTEADYRGAPIIPVVGSDYVSAPKDADKLTIKDDINAPIIPVVASDYVPYQGPGPSSRGGVPMEERSSQWKQQQQDRITADDEDAPVVQVIDSPSSVSSLSPQTLGMQQVNIENLLRDLPAIPAATTYEQPRSEDMEFSQKLQQALLDSLAAQTAQSQRAISGMEAEALRREQAYQAVLNEQRGRDMRLVDYPFYGLQSLLKMATLRAPETQESYLRNRDQGNRVEAMENLALAQGMEKSQIENLMSQLGVAESQSDATARSGSAQMAARAYPENLAASREARNLDLTNQLMQIAQANTNRQLLPLDIQKALAELELLRSQAGYYSRRDDQSDFSLGPLLQLLASRAGSDTQSSMLNPPAQ